MTILYIFFFFGINRHLIDTGNNNIVTLITTIYRYWYPVKTFSRKVGAVLGIELEPSIFVPLQSEGVRIVLGFYEAGNGVHDGEALFASGAT